MIRLFVLAAALALAALPALAQVDALRDPNAKPVEEMTVNADRLNKRLEDVTRDSRAAAQASQQQIEEMRKRNASDIVVNQQQAGGRERAREIQNGAWPPPTPKYANPLAPAPQKP